VRGVQLRGLAPDQVLVLINGKRRHASAVLDTESSFAGTVPVDVNAIPPGAIDHIEILRDGAGAQYGSDAVAGVINIVLKQQRTGGSASVSYGANHTDFNPTENTRPTARPKSSTPTTACRWAMPATCASAPKAAAATRPSAPAPATPAGPRGIPRRPTWRSTARWSSNRATRNRTTTTPSTTRCRWRRRGCLLVRHAQQAPVGRQRHFRYPGDPSNVLALYPNGYRPVTHGDQSDVSVVAGVRIASGGWNWDLSARHGGNIFHYDLSNSANASLRAKPDQLPPGRFDYRQMRSTPT
jgi:iron complex outermembrane receptor protein